MQLNKIKTPQILAIVSAVPMGFFLLIASSMWVDGYGELNAFCKLRRSRNNGDNPCHEMEVGGAAAGLIASLVQIGSVVLALLMPDQLWWCLAQFGALFLALIGLVLPIIKFKEYIIFDPGFPGAGHHNFFIVWSVIDIIFLAIVAGIVLCKYRRPSPTDEVPPEAQDQPPIDPEQQSQLQSRPPTAH